MRRPEQKMWDYLNRAMTGRWHAQRHEDKHSTSIPDVSFAIDGRDGWIELKTIEHWPKNPKAPVYIRHLDAGQVNWIEARGRTGRGAVFLLLAVGDPANFGEAEWVLVRHNRVRDLYNCKLNEADLKKMGPHMAGCAMSEYLPRCLTF